MLEQIKELMLCYQNRVHQKILEESNLQVKINQHSSTFEGYEQKADCDARNMLSDYSYNKFFIPSLKKAQRL